MADNDSDSDSDDSLASGSVYNDIDFHAEQQQSDHAIAVWTYKKYENITLFTPTPTDTLYRVIKYAEQNLAFDRQHQKISILGPGDKNPLDLRNVTYLKPGSVIMVLPKSNVNITIEIDQLKISLSLDVDLTTSVFQLKCHLQQVKGIPVEQQDMLYRDRALSNVHRLFEYHVKNEATLYVLLQCSFDLLVNVETFWGKTYRLYVDPCMTGMDIIYMVFNRTFTKYGPEDAGTHELYVPLHVLVLQHKTRLVHWDYCLGHCGPHTGDTFLLTTVGHQNNINLQTLIIVTETSEKYEVTVSQFDRWSIVAFMLHGLSDVPVDLIRLYKNKSKVDLMTIVGEIDPRSVIVMNVVMTHLHNDLMFGVPLKVNLGNGVVENVKLALTRKVKDVKIKLEKIGVPYATAYELILGGYKLINQSRLQDVIFDLKAPLQLTLEHYPIFIHAPDGLIYKTYINVNHTVGAVKNKIQLKSGYSMHTCKIMMSGEEYAEPDSAVMYETGVTIRSSLFLHTKTNYECFFVLRGGWLIKLKVPINPRLEDLRRVVWSNSDIPEGSITCLQTLLQWFFLPRMEGKNRVIKKRIVRRKLPIVRGALPPILQPGKPRNSEDDFRQVYELVQEREAHGNRTELPHINAGNTNYYFKPAIARHQSLRVKDRHDDYSALRYKPIVNKPVQPPAARDEDAYSWPDGQKRTHIRQEDLQTWLTRGQYEYGAPKTVQVPGNDIHSAPQGIRKHAGKQYRRKHHHHQQTLAEGETIQYTERHIANQPPWVEDLHRRRETNRLVQSDGEQGAQRKRPKKVAYQLDVKYGKLPQDSGAAHRYPTVHHTQSGYTSDGEVSEQYSGFHRLGHRRLNQAVYY